MTTDDQRSDKVEEHEASEDGDKAESAVENRRCSCGVEVSKADSMCPERDCPYRR